MMIPRQILAAAVAYSLAAVSTALSATPNFDLFWCLWGMVAEWWAPVEEMTLTSPYTDALGRPDLIHFPATTQKQLASFLFSEDGLYLSSYRYNMGGDGGNDTQEVVTNGSRVESFLLRNGTYDWSRDHAGVVFLELAQQYTVPYITFFINAAPSAIAGNGAACGWNFTADKDKPFATYIETVLSHWVSKGVDIKYISPMNEPDNDRSDCGQEGMAVGPGLRAGVLQAIRAALDKSEASAVGIIGDETSRPYLQGIPEDPYWLPAAAPSLSAIAVHDYDYVSDEQLAEYYHSVLALTDGHPPPIKFTEICCSTTAGSGPGVFGAQYDPTMTNALIVARYVWQFLTIAQSPSFDWWTAATTLPCSPKIDGEQCATAINETAGYNSGLVYYDGNYNQTRDYNIYYTKRAFMLKHFAYFHRPGSVRYDVPQVQLPFGVNAIASRSGSSGPHRYDNHAASNTWHVLFMNNQTSSIDITLEVPGRNARLTRIVQTTKEVDFGDVALPSVRRGKINLALPAESLVTFQFA